MAADPMCSEACLIASPKAAPKHVAAPVLVHSADRDPRHRRTRGLPPGESCSWAPEDELASWLGRQLCSGSHEDGPAFLFQPSMRLETGDRNVLAASELYTDTFLLEPSLHPAPLQVPLDGPPAEIHPSATTSSDAVIAAHGANFADSFLVPLQQPVLLSTPKQRVTRPLHNPDEEDWIPKRSARIAAKSQLRTGTQKRRPGMSC
jgi:hypothetical protein